MGLIHITFKLLNIQIAWIIAAIQWNLLKPCPCNHSLDNLSPERIDVHQPWQQKSGTKKTALKFQAIKKQGISLALIWWWGRRDSNSHTSRRWNLNPVRLPISPRPHQGTNLALDFFQTLAEDQGFEPWRTVLETVMLPLHQSSTSTQYPVTQISIGGDGETRTLTPRGAGT